MHVLIKKQFGNGALVSASEWGKAMCISLEQ